MIRKIVDVDWSGMGTMATPEDERVVQTEMLLGGKREKIQGNPNQQMSTKTAFMTIEKMLLWTKPKYEFQVLQGTPLLLAKHRQLSNS